MKEMQEESKKLKEQKMRYLNDIQISHLNRASRRKVDKLMRKNISPEQMSDEIKRLSGHSKNGGALIKIWKSIINSMRKPDPYYFHIPKQLRPMMVFPNGMKQADYVKCEKIRKKKKW